MRKTFKYRMYANNNTLAKASEWLELMRQLYNVALEQRIMIYKHNKGQISNNKQQAELKVLKKSFPEYKSINAQVLQGAAKNIKRVGQTQQTLTCGNSQSVVCESNDVECQKAIMAVIDKG